MKVYYAPPGAVKAKEMSGPPDLVRKSDGTVILAGFPSNEDRVRWAYVFGMFITRGGTVRWQD